MTKYFIPLWALVLIVVFVPQLSAQISLADVPKKKFIELGWDIPNTAFLKEHHEEMQRTTPFDGVMLALEATRPDGKKVSSQSVMDPTPWEPVWFEAAVADLKTCRWTAFTDNFIRFNYTPGLVEWVDDAGWKVFCDKTSFCAKIAKTTGLKGLAIDFEPYGKAVFKYDRNSGMSFTETKELVRNRGRQWMQSLAVEFPDMVLFTLFILDFVPKPAEGDDLDVMLEPAHYGLLPSFFNGMLDVAPPMMKIVDGCESGYYHNGIDEFSRRALMIQSVGGPAMRLVEPENRQKYAAQVQVGFGFYLDMYVNPEGSKYYRGPVEGGTRLDRLAENLSAAKETCDEYIWIYGEKRCWWSPGQGAHPAATSEHWEAAIPGVARTILRIKNPVEAARKVFEKQKVDDWGNLVRNGDFKESRAGKTIDIRFPEHWQAWQHDPIGSFSWDGNMGEGSAKASKVKWGCFLQKHPVKPGEYYYVALDAEKQGVGWIGMRIRWQDSDQKWTKEEDDRSFTFGASSVVTDDRPLAEGWQRAGGVVKIPEGAGFLQIQAGIRDQETDGDAAWFDNAVLIRLE